MDASNLIGVVIGGLIGLAGSMVPHFWERRRTKKSARAVARAYVSGILRMEEIRDHTSWYEQHIAVLRNLHGGPDPMMTILGAEEGHDVLQPAVIAQLGFLEPDIARGIATFINMLEGLRMDLKAIAPGQTNIPLSRPQKVQILQADLDLWKDTLTLGKNLVERLQ